MYQQNLTEMLKNFIHENAFESVISKMLTILFEIQNAPLKNTLKMPSSNVSHSVQTSVQGSTLSFLAGCPKIHVLGWYRNFLVYWYLKLDNQVVNSTCPKDKLGWIWRADDP